MDNHPNEIRLEEVFREFVKIAREQFIGLSLIDIAQVIRNATFAPSSLKLSGSSADYIALKDGFDKWGSSVSDVFRNKVALDDFKECLVRRITNELVRLIAAERQGINIARADTALIRYPCVPLVVVRQEAVGHGGFHNGVLGWNKPQFRWVYDCGSWKQPGISSLHKRVTELATRARGKSNSATRGSIDLLFVSHFDTDHVNGLNRLFAELNVDTVILPFVAPAIKFALVARLAKYIETNADLGTLIIEPTAFFSARGVRRIVFIHSKKPESPDTEAGGPDTDIDWGPTKPTEGSEPAYRGGLRPAKGEQIETSRDIYSGIDVSHAFSGAQYVISSNGILKDVDWIFQLYAHDWEGNFDLVRPTVEQLVGVKLEADEFQAELKAWLMVQLSQKNPVTKLQNLFPGLVQNDISLSVYSGPERSFTGLRKNIEDEDYPSGWLMTGDLRLCGGRTEKARRIVPWLREFKPFETEIRYLMMPHHGAAANFDADMLELADSKRTTCFVTHEIEVSKRSQQVKATMKKKRSLRPSEKVRQATIGHTLSSVTSDPASRIVSISGGYGFVGGARSGSALSMLEEAEQLRIMVQEAMSW